jgi:hypothetical protein
VAFRPSAPEQPCAAYARAEFRDGNAVWLSVETDGARGGERRVSCWMGSLRVVAAKVASVLL